MNISHTWINEDGIEMAWATPSRREIAAAKKAGREGVEVLAYCKAPRGWVISEDEDASDDGGNPGCYLIRVRATGPRSKGRPTGERPSRRLTFADLRVGETFEFSSVREFPYSGLACGPWVKTSTRGYEKPGMQCRVGSVKAGVFRVLLCACSDPGCPVCAGKCTHKATTAVRRIDMEDRTGTPMCAQCAADALGSGLFADEPWLLRFHR